MLGKISSLIVTAAALTIQAAAQSAAPIVLDDGTPIRLRTTQSISSADAHMDDRVDFEVVDDVKVGDLVIIKHGTPAIGTVTEAQSKGRMGKGGKLNVNIDFTKAVNGKKVALRGVKENKGGGHTGAMTGAMVGTAIVFWPAAPFFLFMHGKDVTVPKGHEFSVYTAGQVTLNADSLQQDPSAPGAPNAAGKTMLAVSSNPSGADIQLDGLYVGSTPSSVPASVGTHTITISKSGFGAWQRSIQVSGGTVNVAADLSRSSRASR